MLLVLLQSWIKVSALEIASTRARKRDFLSLGFGSVPAQASRSFDACSLVFDPTISASLGQYLLVLLCLFLRLFSLRAFEYVPSSIVLE